MSRGREATIRYKNWNHKNLSMSVGVVCQPNRNKLIEILSTFDLGSDGIAFSRYKLNCLEKFIIDFQSISEKIYNVSKSPREIKSYKDSLFKLVKKVNPLLDPSNIFVSDNNTLTLLKSDFILVDCPAWSKKEDEDDHLFEADLIYQATDRAEDYTYTRYTIRWKTVGYSVTIKQFNKKLKTELVFGFQPKNTAQKKLFFVALCVDNLHALLQYLSSNPETADLTTTKIVDELYEYVLEYNPWAKMRPSEFKKINDEYSFEGGKLSAQIGENKLSSLTETKAYRRLDKVPKTKIQNLENNIKKYIFGQDEIVEAVCKKIKKSYLGLRREKSHIGVFLFYGGTSTGKTEFARVLARELMNSESNLIKIDCNTLQQDTDLAVLLGSAPGYVGYDEGGILSEPVLSNPFRIILFDEAEKASAQLFDFILTIIDEGETFDRKGNLVDFSNCIFIFTSNIGQKEANDVVHGKIGFKGDINKDLDKEIQRQEFNRILKNKLKPEFVSRLKINGGSYYFKNLSKKDLSLVASRTIELMSESLSKNKFVLSSDPDISECIVERVLSNNEESHARDIISYVDENIITPVTDKILEKGMAKRRTKQTVVVSSTETGFNVELKINE